jgi:hypothetical protein
VIGFSDTDMVLAAAPIAAKHKRIFVARIPQRAPMDPPGNCMRSIDRAEFVQNCVQKCV